MIHPSTAFCRREIILKVGGFDADLLISEDRDFFLRLRELTDFHYLDVCLGYRCYHKEHALLHLADRLVFARKYWNYPRLIRDPDRHLCDQFVENRTQDMMWRMRLLMESEGGSISMEMLESLNGVHEAFKDIFGESYTCEFHAWTR